MKAYDEERKNKDRLNNFIEKREMGIFWEPIYFYLEQFNASIPTRRRRRKAMDHITSGIGFVVRYLRSLGRNRH